MANAVTGFDGKSVPSLLPAVGSYCPIIPFKMTVSGTTTSEAVTFSQLKTIRGAILQVQDSGNNIIHGATDADVTWTGNVLTVANGSNFDLDASGQTIYGFVWGDPRA